MTGRVKFIRKNPQGGLRLLLLDFVPPVGGGMRGNYGKIS